MRPEGTNYFPLAALVLLLLVVAIAIELRCARGFRPACGRRATPGSLS
jgi:hypothetical protein